MFKPGFSSNGFAIASLRQLHACPVVKDRLTILVMTGTRVPRRFVIISVGEGSKSHDAVEDDLLMALTSYSVTDVKFECN